MLLQKAQPLVSPQHHALKSCGCQNACLQTHNSPLHTNRHNHKVAAILHGADISASSRAYGKAGIVVSTMSEPAQKNGSNVLDFEEVLNARETRPVE